MHKSFKYLITTFTLILTIFNFSFAQDINVYINNAKLKMDTSPIIKDGRTLVPVRAIFEALGCEVQWNATTKTVTGIKEDKQIKLAINDVNAKVNENNIKLDVPAIIINGRTLVPVRFISESLDCVVKWDGDTKSVHISTKEELKQVTTSTATGNAAQDINSIKSILGSDKAIGEKTSIVYSPIGKANYSTMTVNYNNSGYDVFIHLKPNAFSREQFKKPTEKLVNFYFPSGFWSEILNNLDSGNVNEFTKDGWSGKIIYGTNGVVDIYMNKI